METEERGLFLVQDPRLRSRVLPLFTFDPHDPQERPRGQGTTFRIDPWGSCATAFHVIEDLVDLDEAGERAQLRPNIRLVALEVNGLPYGLVPLSQDAWRPLGGLYAPFIGVDRPPFQPARLFNMSELAAIHVAPSQRAPRPLPFFEMDLRRWRPQIGEHVLALGFAGLDLDEEGEGDERPMHQYIYGSIGEITEVEPADGARRRSWPMMRVTAEWPGGMSGGPIFNEAGHVVGLVSSGIEGIGVSTATYFSGWDMPEQVFRMIDPSNPGWLHCLGAFDQDGQLAMVGHDLARVEAEARQRGLGRLARISYRYGTDEFFRL